MSVPTLTDEEIAIFEQEKLNKESLVQTYLDAIPQTIARTAELETQDGAFKKFFDYYNDDIISQYDIEYRALTGRFIVVPITETDIQKPASVESHRTTPTLPVTDVIRVPEFDGGGTGIDVINEEQHIADQAGVEDALENGYVSGGGFNSGTATTNSSLDSSSTTLDILDNTNPLTISIGDVFMVEDGADFAVVEVTSVTDNIGSNPPFDFTYGIDFVVTPTGTIAASVD
jgi:hypothetical protein